ncbi:hypothetical protein TWF102_006959 [Orbilia oligospora]|uniref:Uncharacterized protein n=1 Tax=Orbilia oligospora TaxID=2813651 RepID=A0A7C8JIG2_ORBOL|nr:hypothetical protein TWF103_005832 [Orbilia oligospora]KAF3111286.1 hypothetical protein TWF102_006959 [Orbilia oligospora]
MTNNDNQNEITSKHQILRIKHNAGDWNSPCVMFTDICCLPEPPTTPIEIAKTLTRLSINLHKILNSAIKQKNTERTDGKTWVLADLWTWSDKPEDTKGLQDVMAYITLKEKGEIEEGVKGGGGGKKEKEEKTNEKKEEKEDKIGGEKIDKGNGKDEGEKTNEKKEKNEGEKTNEEKEKNEGEKTNEEKEKNEGKDKNKGENTDKGNLAEKEEDHIEIAPEEIYME